MSIRLPLGFPRKTTCLKGHEVIELLGAGRQLLVGGRCDTAQRAVGICGREETAQRRPRAAPRCHRDGHTGQAWERGDGSAAAPGTPAVSQGRAHRAGTGGASVAVGGAGGRLQAVQPLEPWLRARSGWRGGLNGKRVLPHRVAVL